MLPKLTPDWLCINGQQSGGYICITNVVPTTLANMLLVCNTMYTMSVINQFSDVPCPKYRHMCLILYWGK